MKAALAVVLALLGVEVQGLAQADSTRIPLRAVSWNPIALTYRFPALLLGYEARITKTFNLYGEIGPVLKMNSTETDDYANRKGFRALLEPRYYLPSTGGKSPFYMALELYAHRITFDRSEVLGYDCDDGCDYYEYVTYNMKFNQIRTGFKIGVLLYPPVSPKRSLFVDLSGGIAYRNEVFDDSSRPMPAGARYFTSGAGWFTFSPYDRRHSTGVYTMAIRVGYKFR